MKDSRCFSPSFQLDSFLFLRVSEQAILRVLPQPQCRTFCKNRPFIYIINKYYKLRSHDDAICATYPSAAGQTQ